MQPKTIKGKITISAPSSGGVTMRIQDNNSHVTFAVVSISHEAFSRALTGEGFLPIEIEVRGLEVVGKQRVSEEFKLELNTEPPFAWRDKKQAEEWLCQQAEEQGFTEGGTWALSAYTAMNTQNGRGQKGDVYWFRMERTKYVEPTPADDGLPY